MTKNELLEFMKQKAYKPMTAAEIIEELCIPTENILDCQNILSELIEEGQAILTRKNKYALAEHVGLVSGYIQGNSRGFAFLIPDRDPEGEGDVFIASTDLKGAMDGDRVLVEVYPKTRGFRREGAVSRVLTRVNKTLVGTFQKSKNFGFVIPDNPRIKNDIYIPGKLTKGAREGDKVVIEITEWPVERRSAEGKIIEVLGNISEAGVDILSVIREYGLETDFSKEVLNEIKSVPEEVTPEDYKGRKDLRDLPMVTIDGADARDLDDAVSLYKKGNKYFLGVHIADVSYYVKDGKPLDKEALKRATSVYFPDRVIPMLPPKLSNNICSLNSGVDRCAMSCLMEINSNGTVENYEITPSLIHVNERMIYDDVREILVNNDKELIKRYTDFVDTFREMEKLALILKKRRLDRGAIDFDFPEAKVILDEKGKPKEIKRRERSIAESIIEEFMLIANETVAEHLFWLEAPAVYRVHEEPTEEKLDILNDFLYHFDIQVKRVDGRVPPRVFQDILKQLEGHPASYPISTMLLRSMQHARYYEECTGHFGLSAKYYCHFTSPIRRYPDLFVHRVLRAYAGGKTEGKTFAGLYGKAVNAAAISSEREIIAEQAEREAVNLKTVEFMSEHVGDVFKGIISGVIASGFFVQLDNLAEGFVRVSTLIDQFYHYDEKKMCIMGNKDKRIFKLGDIVEVRLVRADLILRQLEFELEEFAGSKWGGSIETSDR